MDDERPDERLDERLDDRIAALEARFAHQERAQDELSDMVRAQQAVIRRLLDTVERLEAAVDATGAGPDAPPPHY